MINKQNFKNKTFMEKIKEVLFNLFVLKNYIELKLEKKEENNILSTYKRVMDLINNIENNIKDYLRMNNINLEKNGEEIIFNKRIEDFKIEEAFKNIELEDELKKIKEKYNGKKYK